MYFEDLMEHLGVKRSSTHVPYLEWQCKKKVAFPSERNALKHTKRLRHKYTSYKCEYCGAWHLTSHNR